MELSIFLTKILGLYMIILSIGLLMHAKKMRAIFIDSMGSPPFLLLSGVIALMVGLLIVISHNIWLPDLRILITIVGWLALLKGINLILFPDSLVEISKTWVQKIHFTTQL